ncbi:MAG: serine hydrolase domain-containing protein [Wenzhouxiangellaceae bacterium]|nr:serine hydrolase domain-containing protein [Wenzhouxiangellaceae bacterium]
MMLALLAAAMLAGPACGGAGDDLAPDFREFRDFVADYRLERRIPSLSVALVHGGEIVWSGGFGWQDHDGEEPTTPGTSYLVASISKTFTAATMLRMAEDGVIDLDDEFTAWTGWPERCARLVASGSIFAGATLDDGVVIPELHCDRPITLGQVLSHRVNGTPGERFAYNPVVFGRMDQYIAEKTGRSLRDWMIEYVIRPAGLEDVAAGWRDPGKGHVLTMLAPPFRHTADGEGIEPSPLPNPELNASSGIIASVEALAAYSIALDEGRILSPELRERMWSPPLDSDGEPAPYAYGWRVQDWKGQRLAWHGGWWPDAYAGLLVKAPEADWTLIALGNTDGIIWGGNTLTEAKVEESPLALEFLERFVRRSPGRSD